MRALLRLNSPRSTHVVTSTKPLCHGQCLPAVEGHNPQVRRATGRRGNGRRVLVVGDGPRPRGRGPRWHPMDGRERAQQGHGAHSEQFTLHSGRRLQSDDVTPTPMVHVQANIPVPSQLFKTGRVARSTRGTSAPGVRWSDRTVAQRHPEGGPGDKRIEGRAQLSSGGRTLSGGGKLET